MGRYGKRSRQVQSLLDRLADWLLILTLIVLGAVVAYVAWIFWLLSHSGE
jgi:hypothetical protein